MRVPASAARGSSGLQYKWIVTLVVIFGAFMSILDQTIVNIAIPRLQNLHGLNAFSAGLLLLPQAFASIITALIGGRVVDRFGVRVVVIPGLVLLAFATWQLSSLTLFTPYGWLQVLFVIRGLALGLIIQPLTVSALSDIHPRRFAQASTLNTVLRFVSTSLGIAVLATLVQTQAKIHYGHLAEQVTPASPLGQLASRWRWLPFCCSRYHRPTGLHGRQTRRARRRDQV